VVCHSFTALFYLHWEERVSGFDLDLGRVVDGHLSLALWELLQSDSMAQHLFAQSAPDRVLDFCQPNEGDASFAKEIQLPVSLRAPVSVLFLFRGQEKRARRRPRHGCPLLAESTSTTYALHLGDRRPL